MSFTLKCLRWRSFSQVRMPTFNSHNHTDFSYSYTQKLFILPRSSHRTVTSVRFAPMKDAKVEEARASVRDLIESSDGSFQTVKSWLRKGPKGLNEFAVVLVEGSVIDDPIQLPELASSIRFLYMSGLFPVVLHGAGKQLNDELVARGISYEWNEGIRITTPEILSVAREVFLNCNRKLTEALESVGTPVRPIVSGCFVCEFLDPDIFQFVGDVKSVNVGPILASATAGEIPVLTCLGETRGGQMLNINSSIAATEVAKVLKAHRAVCIRMDGGMVDNRGKLITEVNFPEDYERLIDLPWVKDGNFYVILKQIQSLCEELPDASIVAMCGPAELRRTLFAGTLNGTVFRRGVKIRVISDFNDLDKVKLTSIMEESSGKELSPMFFPRLEKSFLVAYVGDDYECLGLMVKPKECPDDVEFMAAFCTGSEDSELRKCLDRQLWARIMESHKRFFWRADRDNPLKHWFFSNAQGSKKDRHHRSIFWTGVDAASPDDCVVIANCIKIVEELPSSYMPGTAK